MQLAALSDLPEAEKLNDELKIADAGLYHNIAIPDIMKFGRYVWVIEYCDKLKGFYKGRQSL